ncbi:MAG: alpha/beta hydrolase [Chloroflexi bacterium]|nr:alpha/beta hydrolase [Chloroflexota bacterium]
MTATLADDVYAYGLSRYPVPYDSLMVDTPLARTHVLVSGPADSPPLILIHGAGMNALAWINQVEPLSRQFRVYAVDLPGQSGLSDAVRMPMTGSGVADWMAALCDGLGLGTVSVCGGSLGGWVALKFASAYPNRVDKLVLVAPGGVVNVNWPKFVSLLPAVVTGRMDSYRRFVQMMSVREIAEDVLDFLVRMIMSTPVTKAVVPLVLGEDVLRHVRAPMLVVLADHDEIFPLQPLKARAEHCWPGARIVTIENCGHMIPHDRPDVFLREVTQFLCA